MSNFDSLTTRMPNGLTNAAPGQTMGASGIPDPSWAHVYHNDFDTFLAGDWTETVVGTGTVATQAVDGGAILVSTSAGATDAMTLALGKGTFQLVAGKAAFFKLKATLSDVLADVFFAGLVNANVTTLASITDGIYISKAAGSALLTLNSAVGGVVTSVALPALEIPVAATAFEIGLSVDYLGNLAAYFNPTTGSNPISAAQAASSQARGRVAALFANANGAQATPNVLTQALLAPAFSLTNGAAAIKTLSVDYVTAVRER